MAVVGSYRCGVGGVGHAGVGGVGGMSNAGVGWMGVSCRGGVGWGRSCRVGLSGWVMHGWCNCVVGHDGVVL